jgi:branched-chain amino acid aminotransferase
MNVLVMQGNTLRTPPLGDTILNGVTRASLVEIARDLGMETREAPIAIDEIVAGVKNGTITDLMACGTAAVVIGIRRLVFEDGSSLELPGAVPAPATAKLYNALVDIQYGRAADRHGWVREVCRLEASAIR